MISPGILSSITFSRSLLRGISGFYGLPENHWHNAWQLKRIIRQQALLLCLIGIPAGLLLGLWHWRCSGACCLALHPVGCRHHHHQHFACNLCWLRDVCLADGAFVLLQARENGGQGFYGGGYQIYRCDADQEKTGQHPGSGSSIRWPCQSGTGKKKDEVLVVVSLALSVTLFNALCAFVGGFSMEKYVSSIDLRRFYRQHARTISVTTQQMNSLRQNNRRDRKQTQRPVFPARDMLCETRISVDDGGCSAAGLCHCSKVLSSWTAI